MRTVFILASLSGVIACAAWSAETGNLTVSCGRGEYKVEVDGTVKGKCDEQIALAAGAHKVRVAKRGNEGPELYLQQIIIEANKPLALNAEFKKASEVDDSIGSAQFPPQKTLNEMQALDRKIKQIREQFRNDLKVAINKIVAAKNPRYLKLADAKKDEFESEGEFYARVTKEKTELDKEQATEFTAVQEKFEGEYTRQIAPLIEELKKLSGQEFIITAENLTIELGTFNAENNTYPVSIKGKKPLEILLEEAKFTETRGIKKVKKAKKIGEVSTPESQSVVQEEPKKKLILLAANANIPLPREEAREFKQHFASNMLRAELAGNFETPENFTIAEAKIIDDATVKSYSLFSATFIDLENGTIFDSTSKLIWSKNGNPYGEKTSWYGANDYIKYLNKTSFLGFRDWKLPNKNQLNTLVDTAKKAGFGSGERAIAIFLNRQGFTSVQPEGYWSSDSEYEHSAWGVSMLSGEEKSKEKNLSGGYNHFNYYVWPVRGDF